MTIQSAEFIATAAPLALVDRKGFADALARVSKVTERRNTIPILSNLRLVGAGESLVVEGTDLDVWHAITVPAAADSRFAVTAPAHILADTCKRMASEFVEATQGDCLALDFEGARTSLQSLPVADWPTVENYAAKAWGPAVASFTMSAPTLRRMLQATSPAISTEETRYYLNGVFLHVADDRGTLKLRSVATDGHRLVSASADLPDGAEWLQMDRHTAGVIVPRKTVALVLAELKRKGAPESVAVDVGAAWIRFTIGESVITSKLIDGTFPDYCRVIPAGNDKVATVDRKAFGAMVKAVSTISSERTRAVRLTFGPGKIVATVNNPDSGSASQWIEAGYDSDLMDIGFNANYVRELVELLACDRARIELADPGSPTLFRPSEASGDGVDVLAVCMPMRV
ncbi:MAG: DNA polymerase III subunit beta [Rhizobiaceae bacterium]|nr:DNA polymerase III subunit beta [Rhizobiaceae bacterium]